MAEDNDKLLSDEELSAIEDMVASGDLGGEGYNVGVAAGTYDLTLQDTSVGVNVTPLSKSAGSIDSCAPDCSKN